MNLPDETDWTYGYDYENRLVSVADNADYTAAYTYGPDGLRLRVQESNNPNPDRWMQYNGVRPVLEGTLADDTFTTVNRYVWEGDSYYDPLISALIGGSNKFYLYDGLGSTRQLLDDSENVTDTYSYEAFGNGMDSTGSTANPYKYVGSLGYYQTGSSLMHLGARYYMPGLGRFGTQDPRSGGAIDYAPAGPREQALDHLYCYAGNNPVRHVDPSGLQLGDPLTRCKIAAWMRFAAKVVSVPLGTEICCVLVCAGLNWWNEEIGFLPCFLVCQIGAGAVDIIGWWFAYRQLQRELKDCERRYPPPDEDY